MMDANTLASTPMHQTLAPHPASLMRTAFPQPPALDPGLAITRDKILLPDGEFRHLYRADPEAELSGLQDFCLSAEDQPHDPAEVFNQLRWGGQLVYVSSDPREVASLGPKLADRGFTVVNGPGFVRGGWGIPLLSPKKHFVIARKTMLIPPRDFSDRFTYQVELERRDAVQPDGSDALATDHWIVRKEVPTLDRVLARLQFKAPDVPVTTLERRAKKFVDQIFPLFLTREAAMLKVIERDCPKQYLHCFPRVVDLEKDSKGYVRRLWTTWLRNGGKPLTQLQFARQSAELLHILHDRIGIIHLDLRMDNMVITERGVAFVDFGSAVRVNENIHSNAVLSTLFGELMRTSQIQRMMDKMATAGSLTSQVIREAHQQVDKAVDVFYLAVQISQPTANPDLRDLVKYDKYSPEAVELARLNHDILRPRDPHKPRYRTAQDVLQEILRIEHRLKAGTAPRVVITTPPEPVAPSAPPPRSPVKPKVYIWDS
jgi:tRNA A-37 threonylcarbamoyl transferase component Bud32